MPVEAALVADESAAAAASGVGAPLYLTGHRDGRVRVWHMGTEAPPLLATVPFDAGGAGSRLRAVTALQVHPWPAAEKSVLLLLQCLQVEATLAA